MSTTGLPIGATFAKRYRVEEHLGEGGMGAVHLVTDTLLGERVALKIAAGVATDGEHTVERQRREVSLARRVTHPNVARVFDLGVDGGLLFITMEHVPGRALRHHVQRGPLPADDVVVIGHQIASALAAAHDAGVVHLDLKPDNVILVEGPVPRAVLVDFGVSRALGERATGAGTLDYMAPEQLGDEAIGGGADVYALGLLLFELLTGARPFGSGEDRVLARLTRRPPVLAEPVPPALASVVDACLGRQAAERPSARAVEHLLARQIVGGDAPGIARDPGLQHAIVDVGALPSGLGIRLAEARSALAVAGRELEMVAVFDEVLAAAPGLDVAVAARALGLVRAWSNAMADDDVADRATMAVSEAIARAPHLADAHLADALIADGGGDMAYAVRALRRGLARDPLHAYSHEILGRLELEGGVAGDQRLRVAFALDKAHLACPVHIARELIFLGRDDEALAVLDDADARMVTWESRLLRIRYCLWRHDPVRAAALLRALPAVHRPVLDGARLILHFVLGEIGCDEVRAHFERTLSVPTSPRRRGFLHQIVVEMLAGDDVDDAAHHLLGAVQLPLTDIRWLDACPAIAPLRGTAAFGIARATVQLRIDEAFGAAGPPPAAEDLDATTLVSPPRTMR